MENFPKKPQKSLSMKDKTPLVLVGLFIVILGLALAWPKPQYPEVSLERLQDDPYLGNTDARVTIIEYGDYACESCRMWHNSGVLDEILTRYPEQVQFIWRDNARRSTASVKAAEAAQCAHNQGQFWSYHAQLYEQPGGLGVDRLFEYANNIHLDIDEFTRCLDEGQMRKKVEHDMRRAGEYGLSMTPSFLINGETIIGPPSAGYLSSLIEGFLTEEK
jgi:protein-disulfide isomerase